MPCDEAGDFCGAVERIPGMKKDQSHGTDPFGLVRLAAHVSNGLKSRIRPVVGRI